MLFESDGRPERGETGGGLRRSLSYDKIEAFFQSPHNEPATREEVIKGTGLKRSSVTQTMYVSHKAAFSRKVPKAKDGQRFTLFCLRQPAKE